MQFYNAQTNEQCYNAQTTNSKLEKVESNQTSESQSFLSQFDNVESTIKVE